MDRLETLNIVCDGGLNVTADLLDQGLNQIGSARRLINYQPSENQGYEKVLGYAKYSETEVTGDSGAPILGVQPCLQGVLAARKTTSGSTDNAIYYSTGTTWTKINTAARGGSPTKVRFEVYNLVEETIVITDGVNPALKYNGTTDTLINGTGAPSNPKFAAMHLSRLVLAGYGNGGRISISSGNSDTDFTAAGGAIEINVGDTVVGIRSFRDTLYIFCKNSIRKLQGTSTADFVIRDVTTQIGCSEEDTIQEVAGDLLFLAPDGLRSLAATERIGDVELGLQSDPIEPLLNSAIDLNPVSFHSVTIPSISQYRLFYYQSGVDAGSQRGFAGRVKQRVVGQTVTTNYQWNELLGFPVYSAGQRYVQNSEVVVFGHITDGYVYTMNTTGAFDGSAISFVYRTPPLIFNDLNLIKVIHRLRTTIKTEQDTNVSVKLILDEYYGEDIQPSAKTILINGDTAVFGGSGVLFGSVNFAADSAPQILSKRMEGSGSTITIEIFGSNTDLPHRIDDIVLEYATKGRRTTNQQ